MDTFDTTLGESATSAKGLILLPITDNVLLPGMVMPVSIGRSGAAAALQEAARTEQHIAVVLQREPFAEIPGLDDLHPVGTEARLLRYFTGRDGSHNAIVQGVGRVRVLALIEGDTHPSVTVQQIAEPTGRSPQIDARFHQLRERSVEVLALIEHAPPELSATVRSIDQAGALADFVTGLLDLKSGRSTRKN